MDPSDPDAWRWIWLLGSVVFGIGEILTAGSFFLAPFAIGAAVAALVAFGGAGISIGWAAFLGVSVAAFVAMRPLARRMDQGGPVLGLGAHRQIGSSARVLQAVGGSEGAGQVLLGAERWRAESVDGELIPVGTTVSVIEVRGTRLVVRTDPTRPSRPPLPDDSSTGS